MDKKKSVKQHFRSNGHNHKEDATFSKIEKIEKATDMKLIIKKKKRRQMDKKSENICAIWI